MSGPFVHAIDPVIGSLWGIHFWWYGLTYTLGFLTLYAVLHRGGGELGFTRREALDLVLLTSLGTLLGGRFVEVAFYEWSFYGSHLHLIPAVWLGGMSTHGLVLGAIAGMLGTIQAAEALKYLVGKGELLTNRLLVFNALNMSFRDVAVKKNAQCPVCGDHPEITELRDEEQKACDLPKH